MARKKKKDEVEILDSYEEESNGFIEGDVPFGKVLTSFSFGQAAENYETPAASEPKAEALTDNRKIKTESNIATPYADGEVYTIGRYYKLRYSTAKMLNEIKASHPDVNVYMNTVVDEAIRFYYSHLFKNEKRALL